MTCTSAEEQMPKRMALSGAQDAAMKAAGAAMAAVGGAVDPVAMGNAQMYASMAMEASDAAAMATDSMMAGDYQTKAEMYRDMAMEAGMMRGLEITKLANKIINQAAIDNAGLDGKTGNDVPAPISNAKRVGAAMAAMQRHANPVDRYRRRKSPSR